MPELIETLLAVAALTGSAWLAMGVGLSRLFQRHPARAHGILVAASIGTLLTPLLYAAVRQTNGGWLPATREPMLIPSGSQASRDNLLTSPSHLPQEVTRTPSLNLPAGIPNETGFAEAPADLPDRQSLPDLTHAASPTDEHSGAAWVEPLPGKPAFVGAWLLLSLIMLVRLLRDFVAGHALVIGSRPAANGLAIEAMAKWTKRLGLGSQPRLAVSDRVSSPVVWAWSWRPCILVPRNHENEFTSEAIYLHELAHLSRRDHLSALVAELILCLLPWHPLAWWTKRAIDDRAEEACDDWAVTSGCDPADYAQTLVNLAPTSASPLRLAAVAKDSPLKGRIQRLLSGRFSTPTLGRGWVSGLGCFSLAMAAGFALAQPRIVNTQTETRSSEITGTAESERPDHPGKDQKNTEVAVLVLSESKPAEGATVWMEELNYKSVDQPLIRRVGPVTVPKSGKVRFSVSADASNCQFLAKNEAGHLGIGSIFWHPEQNRAKETQITLDLEKTDEVHGQLFFDNQPLADAQCQLESIDSPEPATSNNRIHFNIDRSARILAPVGRSPISVKTDREGRFSLGGIPEKGGARIRVSKEGMGSGILDISHVVDKTGKREPVEVALDLGGTLEISVEGESKPVIAGPVFTQAIEVPRTFNGRKLVHMAPGRSIHDPDFSIPGVGGHPSGTYRLSLPFDAEQGFHFGPPQDVKIEAGKVSKVTLKKIPLAVCSGRIIDAKTGKGIPKLRFLLVGKEAYQGRILPQSHQSSTESYPGITDTEGRYSLACKGNHDYTLVFGERSGNQTDYEFPYWDGATYTWQPEMPHAVIADGAKVTLPDAALFPSRIVSGMVKDDSGKVIDGPYQVFCVTRKVKERKPPQFENGRFTLSRLNPTGPLTFFLRKGNLVNIPSAIPVEKLDAPLAWTINEKNQVLGKGKIVNEKGMPIAGAKVTLVWMPNYDAELRRNRRYDGDLSTPIETIETDSQGRFSFGGLWHQEKYFLRVQAAGFDPEDSDGSYLIGPSADIGETIDFGDCRLNEAQINK